MISSASCPPLAFDARTMCTIGLEVVCSLIGSDVRRSTSTVMVCGLILLGSDVHRSTTTTVMLQSM